MFVSGKWTVCAGILLGLSMVAAPASGATLVDSFDYTDGALTGSGAAGDGWAGGWRKMGSALTMTVSGGAATVTHSGNKTFTNYRLFDSSISLSSPADPIWFSYQANLDFVGGQQNARDQLMLITSADTGTDSIVDRLGFGRLNVNTPAGNTKWSGYVRQTGTAVDISTVEVPENVWSHVVVRLTPTGSGTGTYTMWIDPNLADIPSSTPVLTGSYALGSPYTSIVGIGLASAGRVTTLGNVTENVAQFDNLRISTDGPPTAVPEPAMLSTLGLAALALRRRVRRG